MAAESDLFSSDVGRLAPKTTIVTGRSAEDDEEGRDHITLVFETVDVPKGANLPRKRLRGTRACRKALRAKLQGKRVEIVFNGYDVMTRRRVIRIRMAGPVTLDEINAELARTEDVHHLRGSVR